MRTALQEAVLRAAVAVRKCPLDGLTSPKAQRLLTAENDAIDALLAAEPAWGGGDVMDHRDWLARFDRYLRGEITYVELHAELESPPPTLAFPDGFAQQVTRIQAGETLPTLNKACEVIEALLTHWSPLTSDEDVRDARAFLARVKGGG